jgi:tetraacyldisaccharide 4'-kinase
MFKFLLAPFALLYGIVVYIRNFLFDVGVLKSATFTIPTICVGNLTVGGTGKTPHIEYLAKLLEKDFRVATLSRGYKRKTKGFYIANANSTATEIGDEPMQIHSKFPNITVAVDEVRARGIDNLLASKPAIDVILLDDAFQHRWVKPGRSILLTDYSNLITKDYLLPVGLLRDSLLQKRRADTIIVTKCPPTLSSEEQNKILHELKLCPTQRLYFTKLTYGYIKPVFPDTKPIAEPLAQVGVLALAGIANPTPFFSHLETRYTLVNRMQLPDHYNFSENKIRAIFERFSRMDGNPRLIVTTEKDAARLKEFVNLPMELKKVFFYIPIEVEFLNEMSNDFNEKIIDYVRENKGNNSIYSA